MLVLLNYALIKLGKHNIPNCPIFGPFVFSFQFLMLVSLEY